MAPPVAGAPAAAGKQRQKVGKQRVVGQLVQWKGKYGWIVPSQPLQHPKATLHGGKVYIGVEDIEGPELSGKCMVEFNVYADDTGLGAMRCRRLAGGEKLANGKGMAGKGAAGKVAVGKGAVGKGMAGKGAAGKGMVIKTNLKQNMMRNPGAALIVPKPKGQGKGAGKAGNKAVKLNAEGLDNGPPPPDKAARKRVVNNRIVGKLVRWRGKLGWIKPLTPIDHPDAAKHRNSIYLHEVDVKKGHEMFQGAQVSFMLYADDDGLGAEHCMLTQEQPGPALETPKLKAKPKEKAKGKGKGGKGQPANKLVKAGAMVEKERNRRRSKRNKKKGSGGEGGDAEKKEKKEKTEGGPELPRERISDMPMTGEVVGWKGKFGWVKPAEEIQHELFQKHGGKIYLHQKDVLDGTALKVGTTLEFHVYADSSGLGAEEAISTSVLH